MRLAYASIPLFGQREELQWADAGVMGGGAASLTHAKRKLMNRHKDHRPANAKLRGL